MTGTHLDEAEKAAEFVVAILSEVRDAEKDLARDDSPFRRRAYVRATFASVEGFVFALKRIALTKPHLFEPGELTLLLEKEHVLTNMGDVRPRPRFLRVDDNLRFAFKAFMRFHGSDDALDTGQGWAAFQKAITIRNRVTHPKRIEDLSISDDDVRTIRQAAHWLGVSVLMSVAKALGPGAQLLVIGFLVVWGLMKLGAGGAVAVVPEPSDAD